MIFVDRLGTLTLAVQRTGRIKFSSVTLGLATWFRHFFPAARTALEVFFYVSCAHHDIVVRLAVRFAIVLLGRSTEVFLGVQHDSQWQVLLVMWE
jgi:hypothetical protein